MKIPSISLETPPALSSTGRAVRQGVGAVTALCGSVLQYANLPFGLRSSNTSANMPRRQAGLPLPRDVQTQLPTERQGITHQSYGLNPENKYFAVKGEVDASRNEKSAEIAGPEIIKALAADPLDGREARGIPVQKLQLNKCLRYDNDSWIQLIDALKYLPNLRVLELGVNELQKRHLTDLAQALGDKKCLQSLSLGGNSQIFDKQGIDEFSRLVKAIPGLRELNIYRAVSTDRQMKSLLPILQNLKELRSLDLSVSMCTEQSTVNDFGRVLGSLDGLQYLNIGRAFEYFKSDLYDIFSNLGKLKNLQNFDCSNNKLTRESSEWLGDALRNFSDLRSLNLGGTNIDLMLCSRGGRESKPSCFVKLKELQALNLSWNNLSSAESAPAKLLPKVLSELPSLRTLSLYHCRLKSADMEALVPILKTMPNLEHLDIGGNDLTAQEMAKFAHLLIQSQKSTEGNGSGLSLKQLNLGKRPELIPDELEKIQNLLPSVQLLTANRLIGH